MPHTYAVDSHAAIIDAHCDLPACPTCGQQPGLELWIAALRATVIIPTKQGGWLVTELRCPTCHGLICKKDFLPFD